MLKNYLKIALRNLRRQKGYAFINIFGLAVGIACCVLILLFVLDELSYDRFHEKADRIYRIAFNGQVPDSPPDYFAVTSRPIGQAIRSEYPDAEHVVRLDQWGPTVKHDGRYFSGDDFLFAEPTFFDVFSFPLLAGDPATALEQPYTLVMTEAMKRKYFGEEEALGKTITLNDSLTFTVTGITADVPSNAHFSFDFLTSWSTLEQLNPMSEDEWLNLNSYTYVLLREGVSATAFEAKIADLIMRKFGETLQRIGLGATLELQPIGDIHLYSKRGAELSPGGDIRYIYAFSAIALFMLLIACINFMNLSTARSMERAKEVGVRKVVGSNRPALVRQFLSESVLTALFALLLAVGLVAAALPFFNDVSGKETTLAALLDVRLLAGLPLLTLLVGLLAGSYPAFVLSSFRPVEVLKGAFKTGARGVWLRQGLVVFQFAISVALIAGTFIVFEQLQYMRGQRLGFDREQVLVVDAGGLPNGQIARQYETAKQAFRQVPAVLGVSASNTIPGRGNWVQIVFPEGLAEGDSRRMQVVVTDHDFLETMGIELAAGRGFSRDFETDAQEAVLVNETAVRYAGWGTPEAAIGKTLTFGDEQDLRVVGVIENYHHHSLKQPIEPMVMRILPQTFNYFSLRIAAAEAPSVVAGLEQTWSRLFPGYTFESFFLDDDFDRQYAAEERLSQIFGAFAFLSILIACLGLFGLASFITAQRTKEIGVRKVLGATVPGIVFLLSKHFVRLVLVAVVVASPLAYLGMERWLKDFPYRIEIGPGTFLLAGLLALGIALLTVSYQSVKAALTDPVKSLRYE